MRRTTLRSPANLLALTVVVMFSATASAHAATKTYTVQVASSTSDGSTQVVTTIANTSAGSAKLQQLLGSANLTPPPGFTVAPASASATQGTVGVSGNVVQLRNAALAPGRSLQVTFSGAGCGSGDLVPQAKQANDFKGTGNDFTLDAPASSLGLSSSAACRLSFTRQPATTKTGEAISDRPYDPAGNPVQVTVANATTPVSITLAAAGGPASLSGTITRTTSANVVSFPGISLSAPGVYTLTAALTGSTGTPPASSSSFAVDSTSSTSACTANAASTGTCTATATYSGSTTYRGSTVAFRNRLTAVATQTSPLDPNGTVFTTWDTAGTHVYPCLNADGSTYQPLLAVGAEFDDPSNWGDTVTYTVDGPLAQLNPANQDICFAGTAPFASKGHPLLVTFPDRPGTTYHTGLLLDCATAASIQTAPPPCIASVTYRYTDGTSSTSYTPGKALTSQEIAVSVPATYLGDPRTTH